MTKESLAAVALLTEADAARHFNMGTTRFKSRCVGHPIPSRSNETSAVRLLFPAPKSGVSFWARPERRRPPPRRPSRPDAPFSPFVRSCRALGIARWPHRKLMSLVKLYEDLCMHKSKAEKANLAQQARRVGGMMREIKAYAAKLEKDLSELNQFYNKRKAWPENILKIRQTVYKKRHAQVICNAKKNSSPPSRRTKRAGGAARAPAAAVAVKAFVTAPEPIASETVDAAERMNEYDYGPIELLAGFATRWDEMEVL